MLKRGALTALQIAGKLREADGALVNVILEQMLRTGEVIKQDGGAWRIGKPKLAVA